MASFDLTGRVAVITGAAGLLGEAHARALGGHGARLVLTDLDEGRCHQRAECLAVELGVGTLAARCDVTDRAAWLDLRGLVLERFGRLDVLVNNAGHTTRTRTEGYDASFTGFRLEDWHAILDVNLTGAFLGCQVIGEVMLERGSGSIVNVASMYAVVSPNHRIYEGTGVSQPAAYSVSKAGLLALTRYLGTLWAERGVRVNAVTPGGVFDGHEAPFLERYGRLSPVGRMAGRDEIGGAVVFLASDAASYCNGHNLVVDGGWTAW
jgi:NAD(P)-dependent dehydrogenase (short-subunit alcohol dehydrogenase family)